MRLVGSRRVLIATFSLLLVLPPAARAWTVDARALRATVDAPWQLRVEDTTSGVTLATAPERTAVSAGGLGFRTALGWQHATDVVSSRASRDALALVVATDDPLGRAFEVDVAVDAEGTIALAARLTGGSTDDVEALGMVFVAESGERFFGFGERSNGVDQRGQVIENHVADGPYQPEERAFIEPFVPAPGFRARDDATYFPVPWLLSSRGLGVLIDNAETSYFRVGTDAPERWSIEVRGTPEGLPALPVPDTLRVRFLAGPKPADVLRRFTARTGRQPAPAAPWVLGPWFQPGGGLAQETAQLEKLRAADAPVSVAQTYLHYLPCGDQRGTPGGERVRTQAMHARGVAVTTYFNPMICESYVPPFDDAAAAGALTRDSTGGAFVYNYTGSTIFRVGQFDFTTPVGRQHYHALLAEAVDDGHDGWMEDFGEYTPLDAFTADGLTGTAGHNLYPVQYHCGAYEFVRRLGRPVVRFQRSGWTGVAPCAQVVWNGDPSTDWGYDGLTSALWNGLNLGLSGIAVWGSDIGGFFALGERFLTPEMLVRWVQLGAVSGVMRTQRNGFAVPVRERPQIYDDAQLPNWRRYAKLRTQFYPYITAALAEYRRSGMPLMRHLLLVAPDDPAAIARHDEFLFGPDLLAAPVLAPGVTSREVYLPAGEWVDLWRSARFDEPSGGLALGHATLLPGRRAVTVPAPLEELPLLVRAGALLPLLAPDVDTLADYGDPGGEISGDLVRLRDRRDRLQILAFPRNRSEARLFDSVERLRSVETSGRWELAVRTKRRRAIDLQASLATLNEPFVPCAVEWAGRPLPTDAWAYDAATQVLRAGVAGRRGRLVVHACS